jgi:hypothetical protein
MSFLLSKHNRWSPGHRFQTDLSDETFPAATADRTARMSFKDHWLKQTEDMPALIDHDDRKKELVSVKEAASKNEVAKN